MRIEFSKKAQKQWLRILTYYYEQGGETAANNLHAKYLQKQDRILMLPESGFPEPLLKDKKLLYRAAIINEYYKMIYYVKKDVIRIAAFWDMRMHPDKLRKRI